MAIIDRIDIGGSLFEIKDIAAGTFITREVSDLLYYYTKDNTFTKDEVRDLIAQIQGMSTIPVQVLPTASAQTIGNIYLVPSSDPQAQNLYDEYITVENSGSYSWEKFGSASIDMDGYVTEEDLTAALSGKVDKETGKGLSTNDFTNADKEAVEQSLPLGLQIALDRTQDMDTIRSGAALGATAYQKPSTGIPATDLASAVQTSLGKADTAYQKPQAGIPATDLASGVIPTALSELSEDTTHRTVTDSEKVLWSETNIIHASVISFPAPFSGYTYEQMLAAFGITQDDYIRLANRGGVYSTLMAGSTFVVLGASSGSMFGPVFITGVQGTEIRYRKVEHQNLQDTYSFSSEIVIKGFSGSYNDLADKPTIPPAVTVDQTYDATSQNAQSGVAMAGALAGKQDTINDLATIRTGAGLGATAYQKPASGIPASDIAAGVIPDVSGKENTSNKVTSLSAQSTNEQYPGAKAVYDAINPPIVTTQPAGGFAPNVVYDLGTLTGSVTFALAAGVTGKVNAYHWTFDTGSTAPTITWPSGIIWPDGFTPSVDASKHYEVLVRNGYASMLSYSLS